jgi:hypothetical protein
MNNVHFYGPLQKIEKRGDGTLRVHGIASTESIDSDGEVITAAAMKASPSRPARSMKPMSMAMSPVLS